MTVSTVLVGQAPTITFTAYQDGTQTDLGTITIGIVDANGDTVVASGTSVTDNSDGTYTYTLAEQSQPNLLTVTWTEAGGTDITTFVEVQGSQLFNEYQLRTFDDQAITASAYTDAQVAAVHQQVCEYLEAQTGRSWIRRYNRALVAGSGSYYLNVGDGFYRTSAGLPLNRPGAGQDVIQVISADDGSAVSTSNIIVGPNGNLVRTDAGWTRATSTDLWNCTVEYEYGQPYPVEGVDRIAMMIARQWLVASRIPSSASTYTDSLGSYSFDETRLPFEAYAWIKAHRSVVFA